MITGLYSAASGMIIQERVQDTLAQNLANSGITGYKREEVVIRSFPDCDARRDIQWTHLNDK